MNGPVNAKNTLPRELVTPRPRFYNVVLSAHDAWFGVTVAALFNALGMLIEFGIARKTPGVSATPLVLSASVALLLLLVLFIRRKTPSVQWASFLFLINSAAVNTVLVSTNLGFAEFEKHWVPFQAAKLGCLIAAMIAPGFWAGLATILLYGVSATLQFAFFFPPEIKAQAVSEPWATIAFTLAGILALVYRFRRVQLEQEVAHIHAQNFAIKRLAHAFLSIRDQMNTPLQVLEISVDLLRNSEEPPKAALHRIDRSVQNLKEINSLLVEFEKEIEWQTKQE